MNVRFSKTSDLIVWGLISVLPQISVFYTFHYTFQAYADELPGSVAVQGSGAQSTEKHPSLAAKRDTSIAGVNCDERAAIATGGTSTMAAPGPMRARLASFEGLEVDVTDLLSMFAFTEKKAPIQGNYVSVRKGTGYETLEITEYGSKGWYEAKSINDGSKHNIFITQISGSYMPPGIDPSRVYLRTEIERKKFAFIPCGDGCYDLVYVREMKPDNFTYSIYNYSRMVDGKPSEEEAHFWNFSSEVRGMTASTVKTVLGDYLYLRSEAPMDMGMFAFMTLGSKHLVQVISSREVYSLKDGKIYTHSGSGTASSTEGDIDAETVKRLAARLADLDELKRWKKDIDLASVIDAGIRERIGELEEKLGFAKSLEARDVMQEGVATYHDLIKLKVKLIRLEQALAVDPDSEITKAEYDKVELETLKIEASLPPNANERKKAEVRIHSLYVDWQKELSTHGVANPAIEEKMLCLAKRIGKSLADLGVTLSTAMGGTMIPAPAPEVRPIAPAPVAVAPAPASGVTPVVARRVQAKVYERQFPVLDSSDSKVDLNARQKAAETIGNIAEIHEEVIQMLTERAMDKAAYSNEDIGNAALNGLEKVAMKKNPEVSLKGINAILQILETGPKAESPKKPHDSTRLVAIRVLRAFLSDYEDGTTTEKTAKKKVFDTIISALMEIAVNEEGTIQGSALRMLNAYYGKTFAGAADVKLEMDRLAAQANYVPPAELPAWRKDLDEHGPVVMIAGESPRNRVLYYKALYKLTEILGERENPKEARIEAARYLGMIKAAPQKLLDLVNASLREAREHQETEIETVCKTSLDQIKNAKDLK